MATAVRANYSSDESISAAQTETSHALQPATFRPGDVVPAPGTYWVCHQKHRITHASKVRFTVFPPCAQCGPKVRFLLADEEKGRITEWLRRDPDFKQALKPVRRRRRANPEKD
ncbi:hypothetical protein Acid345_1850 [Candidatus Koribacter versatilis Ellin345]|uniref:Uncharacterized protein n=1 Tax=Koribacter versatilis (strain Ellin345) TaxID=204669 RepID=Q1IQJ9_KORVE|nr:hypothetical protein [Candidatus Koribacter versatilis]ABF40851.1 hypothetical protein Acid345_1850 [Candidatus Koribacter versatilis Ellin345]